jgi:hypothetical protein
MLIKERSKVKIFKLGHLYCGNFKQSHQVYRYENSPTLALHTITKIIQKFNLKSNLLISELRIHIELEFQES